MKIHLFMYVDTYACRCECIYLYISLCIYLCTTCPCIQMFAGHLKHSVSETEHLTSPPDFITEFPKSVSGNYILQIPQAKHLRDIITLILISLPPHAIHLLSDTFKYIQSDKFLPPLLLALLNLSSTSVLSTFSTLLT